MAHPNFLKTALFLIIFSLFYGNTTAQDLVPIVPKNQLEIRHDNDFLLTTDRYYSSGLFLTYRRRLDKGIFGKNNEQIEIELSQLAFTPSYIEAIALNQIDYPYAGFLGLETGWSYSSPTSKISAFLLAGLSGPQSGAGSFQRWYHNHVVLWKTPTWFSEIKNKFHLNVTLSHAKEWQLTPNPFSVHIALLSTISVGTKDVYAMPQVITYFGRRNNIINSIAYNAVYGSDGEIYFSFQAGYRFIASNDLLEGDLTLDREDFVIELKNTVFVFGANFHHRSGNHNYKIGYRFNSKELAAAQHHQYLILAYAHSF